VHATVKIKIDLVRCKKFATSGLRQYDYILVNYYIEQEVIQHIFRYNCSP